MRNKYIWLLLPISMIVSACGSSDEAASVCLRTSPGETADGEQVDVCETVFPERPYLRPAPDQLTSDGESTLHLVALDIHYSTFVDRMGNTYRSMAPDGTPTLTEEMLSAVHAPSKRNLFTVYRVVGVTRPFIDPDDNSVTSSIQVSSIEPAILIKGRAIDEAFLGPWEGTVTERADSKKCVIASPCWDSESLVPIRISFDSVREIENIGVDSNEGPPSLPDGERFELVGAIDNLTASVTSSSGECLSPLDSLGTASPFAPDTQGAVTMMRYPAMHSPDDDRLVLHYPKDAEGLGGASGMSELNALHAANLLQIQDRAAWTDLTISNHGTPNGSSINIKPVSGGGDTCSL